MIILAICLLIFGIIEVVSNSFHLCQGNLSAIAQSAKKQHQELPLDSPDRHFVYKTILMLIMGIIFVISSVLFLVKSSMGTTFTLANVILLSLYGLVQLVIYHKTWKVWMSFLVYSLPLGVFILLL